MAISLVALTILMGIGVFGNSVKWLARLAAA
jgi:hypothetical protein